MKMEVKLVINRGVKNWFVNSFRFRYQKTIGNIINKRDPNLWVFSTWEGTKYSDNARYLFEFVNSQDKDINCVWMTINPDIQEYISLQGYKSCLIGSSEAKKIQRKAGVAICTHGVDDFGQFPYIFGAYIVNLSHGAAGIKKTYYGLNKKNILHRFISETKARVFNYWYRDLTIATSEYCGEVFKRESLINNDTVIIGLPRNDFLLDRIRNLNSVFNDSIINKFGIDNSTKFITYMPTYRPSVAGQKRLEGYMVELTRNNTLNQLLKEYNAKLLIKMHYHTDVSKVSVNENIILLKDADVEDVQKLLQITSILITDYSGCSTDYSLKKKPLFLFAPDIEEYQHDNGLYEEFAGLIEKYGISSIDKLVDMIKDTLENNKDQVFAYDDINSLFNSKADDIGLYRKNIYCYLVDKLAIRKQSK